MLPTAGRKSLSRGSPMSRGSPTTCRVALLAHHKTNSHACRVGLPTHNGNSLRTALVAERQAPLVVGGVPLF